MDLTSQCSLEWRVMVIAILKMESKQKVNLPGAATLPEGLNILLTRVLFKVKNKKHPDKIPLPGMLIK